MKKKYFDKTKGMFSKFLARHILRYIVVWNICLCKKYLCRSFIGSEEVRRKLHTHVLKCAKTNSCAEMSEKKEKVLT